MSLWQQDPRIAESLDSILGYLNFSEGAQDNGFLNAMNLVFAKIDSKQECPRWKIFFEALFDRLESVAQGNPTFRDSTQAKEITRFCRDDFLSKYRKFHRNLLNHHSDDELFSEFFVSRLIEKSLECFASDEELTFQNVQPRLDDYIGYRPIATLESHKIEPRPQEWTRPIPIYIAGVGSANGRYQPYVDYAIKMISAAPAEIRMAAQLDLELLDEIAIDPRAYDFEHPVNKRPNYHFGQWDPHHLDLSGYYRRFVVQQVTLDALASRCERVEKELLRPELVVEAGAVLAGTILMASAICGRSPEAFDSTTSIATILPGIAQLRDSFYKWLLTTIRGKHGERLLKEAKEKRQPFGGARQSLNAELANLRESQLEKVRLSEIYARMGYANVALDLAANVHTASARIRTVIECKLTEAVQALRDSNLEDAADHLQQSSHVIREGIDCGAIVDPWNILGFDAQFSLFPAMENSVPDDRAGYLVDVMNQSLALYSALWSHSAAQEQTKLCEKVRLQFEEVVEWWHQFAAHTVSNVDAVNGKDLFAAAEKVARGMQLWKKESERTGNAAFWNEHSGLFETPRAFELIINALFEKEDLSASMALLMFWLLQAESIGLETAESSFHHVIEKWAKLVCEKTLSVHRAGDTKETAKHLKLIRKFMDYLEANAESYWSVPSFELGDNKSGSPVYIDDEDDVDETYSAAYDDVVYIDSTDDGIDSQIFESEDGQADLLESEARRLEERLRFHESVAHIWELLSPVIAECSKSLDENDKPQMEDCVSQWATVARHKVAELHQLLFSVEIHKPDSTFGDHDSMVEYDRQRFIQEGMLDRIIAVTVATRHSMRMLNAVQISISGKPDPLLESIEILQANVFAAIFLNHPDELSDQVNLLFTELKQQPLLYVPIARNGAPSKIELVKSRQLFIRKLLEILPRYGLIERTFELLNVARSMERMHPVGNGAVTEFDELFEIGFRAVVDCLITSAEKDESTADQRQLLFRWLERFTESSLIVWLKHSRTLRLSILEKVHKKDPWRKLIQFIKNYGKDIFTQRFLNFSNIRGILHKGVDRWLATLAETGENNHWKLMQELETQKISKEDATQSLSLILEAMLENHLEYQDYNSTTTQSDQGNQLYMLIDFLRLKVGYDRISWHLRPVFWAHENLVYACKDQVAKRWRRSLIDRIHKKADRFVHYLERLQRRYSMQMPSVANRIREKFVKTMHIDRMKALVAPAMEKESETAKSAFEMLSHDASQLLQKPEGSGIKVPAWLAALEDEVSYVLDNSVTDESFLELLPPPLFMKRENIREQLNGIAELSKKRSRPPRPETGSES